MAGMPSIDASGSLPPSISVKDSRFFSALSDIPVPEKRALSSVDESPARIESER